MPPPRKSNFFSNLNFYNIRCKGLDAVHPVDQDLCWRDFWDNSPEIKWRQIKFFRWTQARKKKQHKHLNHKNNLGFCAFRLKSCSNALFLLYKHTFCRVFVVVLLLVNLCSSRLDRWARTSGTKTRTNCSKTSQNGKQNWKAHKWKSVSW